MSASALPSTNIERVAAQLEGDMRQRGLRPGDRYLTAEEASRLFDVSSMKIHRAMQTLAEREVLVRQRSRGTFVGPKFRATSQTPHNLDVLHLAMAMDYHRTQSYASDALVDEFAKSLPGITVQVHHLQEGAAHRYVGQIVSRIDETRREAFVLIRCPREVQTVISQSKLPAVVYGQAYPSVPLSCVKHDQVSIGRLMASHALKQGARRFALLTHAHWRFGDHQMIDAVVETLDSAGISLNALKIRSVPPDRETVEHVVEEMLLETEPPDAFLCRTASYASIVQQTISQCAADHKDRRYVISGGHDPRDEPAPFSRIVACMTLAEQVDRIARMLTEMAAGSLSKPGAFTIPVKFEPANRM